MPAIKSSSGILAVHDEERHRRLFEGFLREYDDKESRGRTC